MWRVQAVDQRCQAGSTVLGLDAAGLVAAGLLVAGGLWWMWLLIAGMSEPVLLDGLVNVVRRDSAG